MGATAAAERILFAEYGRTLIIRPAEGEDVDALFDEACAGFENNKIEQDSAGNVYILSPTGGESSYRNSELTAQLSIWAKNDGRGSAFDSNVLFRLPDQSRRGPDAAWVSNEKLKALSKLERRKFLPVVPEFVVQLKSPSDSLAALQMKMRNWISNGVELGWLLHPDEQVVFIYRQEMDAPQLIASENNASWLLMGDGPVSGFVLDLKPIWTGLDF